MTTLITPLPLESSPPGRATGPGWIARFGAWLWRALEATGQARARRHLIEFADRCETNQPQLAKELRAASNDMLMG